MLELLHKILAVVVVFSLPNELLFLLKWKTESYVHFVSNQKHYFVNLNKTKINNNNKKHLIPMVQWR